MPQAQPFRLQSIARLAAAAALGAPMQSAAADWQALNRVAEAGIAQQQTAQRQIEALDDQAQEDYAEYRRQLAHLEDLRVYAEQLDALAAQQQTRLDDLQRQIEQAAHLDRKIVPLMEDMHEALGSLLGQDIPFLQAERAERLQRLRGILDNPELSMAVRFRSMYEALQIELDYGRTLEAYEDTLDLDGAPRAATVLRVGRVALYALSADRRRGFRWDRAGARWVREDGIASDLHRAVRMARKQIAPDLLTLPMDAPARPSAAVAGASP